MIRIGLIYIVCHVYWVGNRLQFVHKEIHTTIQIAIKYPQNTNITVNELKILKSLYGRIWKISRQINERFNWTILTVVTFECWKISNGIYWVFMRIRYNHWVLIWQSIAFHVPALIALVVLIQEIEYWRKMTKKIVKSIFVKKHPHETLIRMIRKIAYTLHLCPFQFSAMNFFYLSKKICVPMISGIVTLMFLLVSISPSYDN
ncbi:uncharacterized protein LOC116339369 [Contarinia nasturtii]|uniref:uncharacterized protein LOC116339369 n=1 Tax=Contarinia nasturtii TaxID=265458 RepID=UPI0012D4357A|nr:uncharacterized protein LOC116339369 [Contarinia nasturtii]